MDNDDYLFIPVYAANILLVSVLSAIIHEWLFVITGIVLSYYVVSKYYLSQNRIKALAGCIMLFVLSPLLTSLIPITVIVYIYDLITEK